MLVFHNVLWAHYKGAVFTELAELATNESISIAFVHVAQSEKQRIGMGSPDYAVHRYPYAVLFEGAYEATSFWMRLFRVLQAFIRNRPKVVLLPGYSDPVFWILLAFARIQRCKTILALDSQWIDKPRKRLREAMKSLFVRNCDMAFTYGTKSRDYLRALGMPESRIVTRVQATPNDEISTIHGLSLQRRTALQQRLNLRARNFAYIGRFAPEKNLRLLVSAYADLVALGEKYATWGLLLVGDGSERDPLFQLVAALNLTNVAILPGQHWREVPRYLAAADVLVLPSTSEPWGLVVNEAMACSMPVIVSDHCGSAHDLVEVGKNGYVFEANSKGDLLEKMKIIAQMGDSELSAMGSESKQLISQFSPAAAAKQMLSGVKLLLSEKRQRGSSIAAKG